MNARQTPENAPNPARITDRDDPRRAILPIAVLAFTLACGGNTPTEPSGETHGPEGQGGESGESGTQYAKTDTARETRSGVDLVMAFEAATERFTGTVTNTTAATVAAVRVEIHLDNGVELGPSPREDLAAGETRDVVLDASGQAFNRWSVHVEIGSSGA